MRSPSTLCWAALALVSAVSSNAFQLPPYRTKSLDCQALKYPAQDRIVAENPEWTKEYDLTGIPDIAPNVYDETKDICAQHKKSSMNAECGDHKDEPIKCQNKKQWAFTYDDGPSQFTARVRDSLKQAGDIKAIFFVVGSRLCDDDDGQMIASLNAGHEIGVHTWSHPRLSALTNGQIIAEIKWAEMAIMELTGIKPKYIRPPYGNMDDRVRFIIKKMGYTPILWTTETNDWAYNFADENDPQQVEDGLKYIKGNITKYIKSTAGKYPGTISLEHDIASIPTTAASHVIELVKKGGWTDLVPMTTCLGDNSFAQNGIIVAGGKTAEVPAKKEPAAEVPAKKEPAAAATPTKSQKPPANAQAATQESSGTSFSGSLGQTVAMAAAGAMAFFAVSM